MRGAWSRGVSPSSVILEELNRSSHRSAKGKNFSAGVAFSDREAKDLPVVLISLLGCTRAEATSFLRTIHSAQIISMAFKPVILTDIDMFSIVRPYGWVIEHVMGEHTWNELRIKQAWLEMIRERVALAFEFFGATDVILADQNRDPHSLLGALHTLTGVSFSNMLQVEEADPRAPGRSVRGWRGWMEQMSADGSLIIEGHTGVNHDLHLIQGDSGNALVIDTSPALSHHSEIVRNACDRHWSVLEIDCARIVDDIEMCLVLGSLVDTLAPDGTLVMASHEEQLARLTRLNVDDRIAAVSASSGTSVVELAKYETRTMIHRASAALLKSRTLESGGR